MGTTNKSLPTGTVAQSRMLLIGRSSTQAKTNLEQRWARRKRASTPAYLTSERLSASINCLVCDSSSTGALVQLVSKDRQAAPSVDDVPADLTLVVAYNREITYVDCAVVRRFGTHLGLKYKGYFRTYEKQSKARR